MMMAFYKRTAAAVAQVVMQCLFCHAFWMCWLCDLCTDLNLFRWDRSTVRRFCDCFARFCRIFIWFRIFFFVLFFLGRIIFSFFFCFFCLVSWRVSELDAAVVCLFICYVHLLSLQIESCKTISMISIRTEWKITHIHTSVWTKLFDHRIELRQTNKTVWTEIQHSVEPLSLS